MQYIILDGKTPCHKFKDGVGSKSWEEVKDFDNVAVIVPKGYIVLDFDTTSDAEIMLKIVEGLDLKCRVMKTTRGIHVWFKTTEEEPKNFIKNRLAIGIYSDRKSGGRNAYVKIKQEGQAREWLRKPKASEIQEVPKWLTPISAPGNNFNFKGMGDGSGRNQELFNYIVYLQTKGFTRDEIRETIQVINEYVFEDPLDDYEISTICRDEAFKPDDVIAEQIAKAEEKVIFQHNIFAEEIIKEHRLIQVNGVIYEYLDGYYQPAEFLDKYIREKKPDIKNNQKSEVLGYIRDMKKIRFDDISSDPYIINLKNTRFDIRTGKCLEFTPDAIEFARIPVTYDPSAYCSDLDRMLNRVFCGDQETIDLFEEMLGYTLIKSAALETAFMSYGDGSNGKSTILDLIKTFLGARNYSSIPLEKLSARFSTAELEHKLANISDDVNDISIRDNGTIKQLISGKSIQVERKGERPYDMVSYATQIFSCNEIPKSFDNSNGFFRRWIYIPFMARFTPNDKDYDPFIKDKIITAQSLSYLLNKSIEGTSRLLKNKRFTEPAQSLALKEKHRVENSLVLSWIDDEAIDIDIILTKERKEIYSLFSDWCRVSNIKTIPGKMFFYNEVRRKFDLDEKPKRSNGKDYFRVSI